MPGQAARTSSTMGRKSVLPYCGGTTQATAPEISASRCTSCCRYRSMSITVMAPIFWQAK